jgi:hypothetical protein
MGLTLNHENLNESLNKCWKLKTIDKKNLPWEMVVIYQ